MKPDYGKGGACRNNLIGVIFTSTLYYVLWRTRYWSFCNFCFVKSNLTSAKVFQLIATSFTGRKWWKLMFIQDPLALHIFYLLKKNRNHAWLLNCSSVDILTIFTHCHFLSPTKYIPSFSWPSLYALSAHHSFLTWKVDFWIFSLVGDRVGCQDWNPMEMQVNSQPLLL